MKEIVKKLSDWKFFILIVLIIGGAFYWFQIRPAQIQKINSDSKNNSAILIQQTEIDSLKTQIQILKEKDITKPQIINTSTTTPSIDPSIKIEICKTEAKSSADNIAIKQYQKAFEQATAQKDYETAQMYLNFTIKPEHPADYDDNYNIIYINCLSK